MSIKQKILHYLYGIFAQAFNGAIAAVAASLGLLTTSAFVTDIPKMNFHEALGIFLGAFAWNAFFYLKSNPMPDQLPEGGQLKAAMASVIPVASAPGK